MKLRIIIALERRLLMIVVTVMTAVIRKVALGCIFAVVKRVCLDNVTYYLFVSL